MSYNTYDKYISSETKWFDKIPKHWDIRPIKHLAKTIPGGTPSTSNLDYWENGSIPWLPSGMVQNCQIDEKDVYKYITEKGLLNSATKYIGRNSVLIALTGATCANIGYLTFKATANQSVISIEPYETFSKYIYYALLSQREQILDKKTGGAQSGINEEDVKHILIPTMNFEEQKQIANYLDKKTAKIDATIAKNEELIQLLEEKRVALINQVVTRGLNPDVPMKDSGVEWIGEIPEHWEVNSLKHLANLQTGTTPSKNIGITTNDGINWFTPGDFDNTFKLTYSNKFITSDAIKTNNIKIYPPYSILMVCIGATIGKLGATNDFSYSNQQITAILPKIGVNYKYLLYYLISKTDYIKETANFTTLPILNNQHLSSFEITQPPKDEQKQIGNYLDYENTKINSTITKIQENISFLEEYKTSLIHHVVTGKIDVRGEEI